MKEILTTQSTQKIQSFYGMKKLIQDRKISFDSGSIVMVRDVWLNSDSVTFEEMYLLRKKQDDEITNVIINHFQQHHINYQNENFMVLA
jgi:hypothetical protein